MKKKITIISLLLACVFSFGACGGGKTGTSNSLGGNETVEPVKAYEGGIHEYSAQSTSEWLIKNRNSDYKILIPEGASNEITSSVEDMQSLIFEASGARLDIIEETSAVTASTKVISIGNTKTAEVANVKATADLEESGYIIKTVGNNVFVVGNSDYAVSFGVYGFLEAQFGFECFSDTYYYIDKADSVSFLNLNVKEVPDLGKIQIGSGYTAGKAKRRMQLLDRGECMLGQETVHSAELYIPATKYNDVENAPDTYHPKWFASGADGQLCYMAQGDETERTAFVNEVANIFIGYLQEDLNKSYFTFGQHDAYTWCGCDACDAAYAKYSSNAAVVIQFLNDVEKVIDAWMANEGKAYARDYLLIFIAYQETLAAPQLVDDSVKCGEHVCVMLCPYQLDLQNSLYAEVNADILKNFEDWRKVSSKVAGYNYFYLSKSFLYFYDCYEEMKELLLYFAESNTKFFYTETPPTNKAPAYHAMRSYILAKLAWNVNLDIDELIEHFCEKYYMDASDIMLEIFYQEKALYGVNKPALTMKNFFSAGDLNKKQYWPKNLLMNWYNLTNEALDRIEYLKKLDVRLYNEIYNHITCERISFEYGLISLYEKELPTDFVNTLKIQTKQDANANGILKVSLFADMSSLFDSWGV